MIRFYLFYWVFATLALSGMFLSVTQNWGASLLLSVTMLPIVVIAKYLSKEISFSNLRTDIFSSICLCLFIFLIQYATLMIIKFYLLGIHSDGELRLLFSPLFPWLLFIAAISVEKWLLHKFYRNKEKQREQWIEFISDRKRITLEIDRIQVIESCDNEVWVKTTNGEHYRTKMNISQWESVLDDRFLRIHRAFMVNRSLITHIDSHAVYLDEQRFEVSRKYKERIANEWSASIQPLREDE